MTSEAVEPTTQDAVARAVAAAAAASGVPEHVEDRDTLLTVASMLRR